MKFYLGVIFSTLICSVCTGQVLTDSLTLHDIDWDKTSPASFENLQIPSNGSRMQGFMYKANGSQKHPTLLLLHGFPGNERNLDLAQVVRAHGWNVIYFDYRGTWGSEGKFSFTNSVQDAINVVDFCKKYQDSLQIDTANMVLFAHSFGGWVCLKALKSLPSFKKAFIISAFDIYGNLKSEHSELKLIQKAKKIAGESFVVNASIEEMVAPFFKNPLYYNLETEGKALADKQIIMIDEHPFNKSIADSIKKYNRNYFNYQVWQTDHSFSNKRVALIKSVLLFLGK